ncbi:MAG: hypothetical protein AEth_00064 [Candidatus Argoarchaeum ethanivorans]|uniref:Uncharacterized protein n=1 Tax=Candidatus Argoarchaeum ethanivorans TaxID=2608793 RepID=A0A8B3S6J7_9EURY|nr:MAG: hypothetical protein AEth_00064 [Candidatus Argoarchaeum ethanivorans]
MFLAEPVTEKYDIKIFETLPLYLKVSYYLYKWRRLTEDQLIVRQKLTDKF